MRSTHAALLSVVAVALHSTAAAQAVPPPPPASYESPDQLAQPPSSTDAPVANPSPARQPLDTERPPQRETPSISHEYDGDATRVILMPSAFRLRPGQRLLNTYQLGSFEMERALGERWQLGIQSAVPVGVLGLGAMIRTGIESKLFAVGAQVQALAAWLFVDQAYAFVLGAGAVLTIGTREHYLNVGAMFHGLFIFDDDDWNVFGALTPHIGGVVSLGSHVRLAVELWLPHRTDDAGRSFGSLAIVLYGLRIYGPRFWMDLGFFRHLCEGCSESYQKVPMGYPYMSVGRPF